MPLIKRFLKRLYSFIPFKKEIFSFIRPLGIPERIYRHLHFKDTFRVKVDSKHSFKVHHIGAKVENEIFWDGLFGSWEKHSMKIWTHLCKSANYIFDVGANTGIYSLVGRSVNSESQIYAFEPVARIFDKLVNNVKLNQYKIHTNCLGLSNENGMANIFDPGGDHLYSVTINKNIHSPDLTVTKCAIPIARFDTWFEQHNVTGLDLMKIDVETHEPEVLEGMGSLLINYKPTLLIEVLNDEVGQKINALIEGLNYQIFSVDEKKGAIRMGRISKSHSYNYLICQPQVADSLSLNHILS
jgi:FkbM family methyltransferase